MNQLVDRIRATFPAALYRQPPPHLIAIAIMALAVIVLLLTANRLGLTQSSVELFEGQTFDQRQLMRIQTELARAGLNNARRQGNRLLVPRARQSEYLAALAEAEIMPRDFDSYYDQLLQQGQWYETSQQRKLRVESVKELQTATMLRELEDIVDAHVKFIEIDTGQFATGKQRRATVAIRTAPGRMCTSELAETVQAIVTHAFGANDVVVVNMKNGQHFRSSGNSLPATDPNQQYAATQRMYESMWRAKIRDRLALYDDAQVSVTINLRDNSPTAGEPASPSDQALRSFRPPEVATLVPRDLTAMISVSQRHLYDHWRKRRAESQQPANSVPDAKQLDLLRTEASEEIRRLIGELVQSDNLLGGSQSRIVVSFHADRMAHRNPQAATTSLSESSRQALFWLCSSIVLLAGFALFHYRDRWVQRLPGDAPASTEPSPTLTSPTIPGPTIPGPGTTRSHSEPVPQRADAKHDAPSNAIVRAAREDPARVAAAMTSWIEDAA